MRKFILSVVAFFSCFSAGAAVITDTVLSEHSPDQKMIFETRISRQTQWQYRVVYQGETMIDWSPLGFIYVDGISIPYGETSFSKAERKTVNRRFPWLFGENDSIHDDFRQMVFSCRLADGNRLFMELRVYNNELAFRYHFPKALADKIQKLVAEQTGFVLTKPYTAYQYNTETVITPTPVASMQKASDIPLVLASPNRYIAINEAANENYTKATVAKMPNENALAIRFGRDTVSVSGEFYTPWRTITIAATAAELAGHSDLLYRLNPPPDTKIDYSWIKPGKLIRDMTLTTKGALECIDFASEMNFQYVMFDAGWYGKGYAAEFDKESDPHRVVAAIDMPAVIAHGKEKGIGLILYVNYVGLRKHNLDTLFGLYKNWGVKGLKFGFVNGLAQSGINWLVKAVAKAQQYGFIIDVHDNYKPTGISRTLPAWLTQEGVRGNENNPDAFHNTTLPFTRFLSGPADYTFCYRSQNDSFNHAILDKKLQVSKAHQLALTVIFYSPLQSMLWYGKPSYYQVSDEIDFFKEVPTTWDRTLHISGEIGRFATVARKKNNSWFIGSASAIAHSETIRLDFLDKGKTYTATSYEDDGKEGIVKKNRMVKRGDLLEIKADAKGGEVVIIK